MHESLVVKCESDPHLEAHLTCLRLTSLYKYKKGWTGYTVQCGGHTAAGLLN